MLDLNTLSFSVYSTQTFQHTMMVCLPLREAVTR